MTRKMISLLFFLTGGILWFTSCSTIIDADLFGGIIQFAIAFICITIGMFVWVFSSLSGKSTKQSVSKFESHAEASVVNPVIEETSQPEIADKQSGFSADEEFNKKLSDIDLAIEIANSNVAIYKDKLSTKLDDGIFKKAKSEAQKVVDLNNEKVALLHSKVSHLEKASQEETVATAEPAQPDVVASTDIHSAENTVAMTHSKFLLPTGKVNLTQLAVFNQYMIDECKSKGYIVVDTETTGLNPNRDALIEICAIKYLNGQEVYRYTSLINPKFPIPKGATEINHITDDMVSGAPVLDFVIDDFYNLIKDDVTNDVPLVAHNAMFDMKFIGQAFCNYGYNLDFIFIDTLALSRKLNIEFENHKLATIADNYNLSVDGVHRADYDAIICAKIFDRLLEQLQSIIHQRNSVLTDLEIQLANWIKQVCLEADCDINWLSFKKGKYFSICTSYPFMKFKTCGKSNYAIITNEESSNLSDKNMVIPCANSESSVDSRYLFSEVRNLEPIKNIILARFKKSYDIVLLDVKRYPNYFKKDINFINENITI